MTTQEFEKDYKYNYRKIIECVIRKGTYTMEEFLIEWDRQGLIYGNVWFDFRTGKILDGKDQ